MLDKLAERVRSIDINQILDEVLEGEKTYILDLIRSQLIRGKKGDGDEIGWYSTTEAGQNYVQFKIDRGLFPEDTGGAYNLLYEGHFYSSLIINIGANDIEVLSTDSKIGEMAEHLDFDVNNSTLLTLTPENLEILQEKIKPLIQNKINARLGI